MLFGGSASGVLASRRSADRSKSEKAVEAEVRLYDHLFAKENPAEIEEGQDFLANLNPDSLETLRGKLEPSLQQAASGQVFQFERIGYFCADSVDSTSDAPVFNRTVTLRDTWAKLKGAG